MEDLILYSDIKENHQIQKAAGVCPTSEEFRQYVNTAIRQLYRKGDWNSSLRKAQFCIQNGCIVWPRFVGRLRALTWSKSPVLVNGQWYEFLPWGPGLVTPGCFCSDFAVVNHGTSPVFRNVPCGAENIKIRAYTQCQADLGKQIKLFGTDSNGNPLVTKDTTTNTWSEGITLTLIAPFVSTTQDIRTIIRIIKPETECRIRLFMYDTVRDVLIDMAVYEPSEKNPNYLASIIGGGRCQCPTGCDSTSITALFKLTLYDLVDDTDISPIQSLDAIASMISSIKAASANNTEKRLQHDLEATNFMNILERDYLPTDQVPVEMATWGSARLERAGIGWNF